MSKEVWTEGPSIHRKSADEFRATGLLMFVNAFLHIFGWVIVVDENGNMYPGRTCYRGFSYDSQERAYKKLSNYIKENAGNLYDEVNE